MPECHSVGFDERGVETEQGKDNEALATARGGTRSAMPNPLCHSSTLLPFPFPFLTPFGRPPSPLRSLPAER
jgi:hypothetical protein